LVTLPFQDFAGLNASVSLLLSLGIDAIHHHIGTVLEPVRDWCGRQGVPLRSPRGEHGSAILCVAPSDPVEAHRLLRAEGVVSSLREGSIRLSPHCYNTVDEMERVVAVLARAGAKATAG